MTEKLKPCPLCDSTDISVKIVKPFDTMGRVSAREEA